MNKTTIVIYAVIVGFAILSSVLKKRKKAAGTGNQPRNQTSGTKPQPKAYQQPNKTQPKSLEDILQSLLNEQKPVKPEPKKEEQPTLEQESYENKYQPLETEFSDTFNEGEYYSYDTELEYDEEMEDYDNLEDHHLHGKGFDEPFDQEVVEEKGEWEDIDWRKAVITAEILKRPEY